MTLTDVATGEVVTASAETGVRELLEMMDDRAVGSVVVTDGDEPVGIVTDRMIALSLREIESVANATAEDVMTTDLVTIDADESHFRALETMNEHAIRRLPIVDGDGNLAGIITLDDLLVVTAAELSHASDVIEQQAGPL